MILQRILANPHFTFRIVKQMKFAVFSASVNVVERCSTKFGGLRKSQKFGGGFAFKTQCAVTSPIKNIWSAADFNYYFSGFRYVFHNSLVVSSFCVRMTVIYSVFFACFIYTRWQQVKSLENSEIFMKFL